MISLKVRSLAERIWKSEGEAIETPNELSVISLDKIKSKGALMTHYPLKLGNNWAMDFSIKIDGQMTDSMDTFFFSLGQTSYIDSKYSFNENQNESNRISFFKQVI